MRIRIKEIDPSFEIMCIHNETKGKRILIPIMGSEAVIDSEVLELQTGDALTVIMRKADEQPFKFADGDGHEA